MKTKKMLSVLLAAGMVTGMMAGAATTVHAEAEETYKVAFLPTDMSATFASWLASELETAFKGYDDMELTVIDSKNNLETQISAMETCVSQGYDYIILLPLEPAAEDDLVESYIEDGTPMMNINLDDLAVEKASSVIANPYDLGTVVAEHAATLLPEDANVVVLLGPSGNTDSIERRKAYEDVIFSKNSGITILDEQIGDWEKSKGMEYMENWLQVHEKIDAVISMNDAMAIGAFEAAKDAGVADDILFFGVDGLADAAVAIEADEMDATALQDAQVMAEEGARIVHEVLTGENKEGFEKVQIPVTLITKDNVDEFITRYTENGMIK
ncbi:MAG: sugar ABC transporter substrate-binding protein [Eubacteriales bacterium]|nr:sugar ABC transporter substrate-binding protein [Eubacteriales bacterium]